MRRIDGWRIAQIAGLGLIWALGSACGGGDPVQKDAAQTESADDGEWEMNTIPVIYSVELEPESPAPGGQVTAQVRANDEDGDELELGFAWSVNGRPVRASGPTLSLDTAMKGDPITVTVTASDGYDESEPVTAQTLVGNTRPVIQSVVFDPLGTIHRGQPVSARPIAADPDGDALDYEYKWWVNDRELSSTSDRLDTSRLKRGDEVRVEVVATDGYSRSNAVRSQPIRVENSPPQIVSTPANAGDASTYLYHVEAKDPDGDLRLRFRLEQAPPGMVIDPISGSLSWTPPADATGSFPVEVVVDDLQGGKTSQRFTVEIGEAPAKPAAQKTASARGADPSAAVEEPSSDDEAPGPAAAEEDDR